MIPVAVALLTGFVVGYVYRAVRSLPDPADTRVSAPPTVPAYLTGIDGLDMPPYYHRVGLPGRARLEGRSRG